MHLLFNNADVGECGGLAWEQSEKDWTWALGVNLWGGVIHGVRTFTPRMLESAARDRDYCGHTVNTASMAGVLNAPLMGAYNVSKHAVVSLSETLYQDLSLVGNQLQCSVLCPYFVPTGISQSQRNRPTDLAAQTNATKSQLAAEEMGKKSGRLAENDGPEYCRKNF